MEVDLGNISLDKTIEEIQRKRADSEAAHKNLLKDTEYITWYVLVSCAMALLIASGLLIISDLTSLSYLGIALFVFSIALAFTGHKKTSKIAEKYLAEYEITSREHLVEKFKEKYLVGRGEVEKEGYQSVELHFKGNESENVEIFSIRLNVVKDEYKEWLDVENMTIHVVEFKGGQGDKNEHIYM